jgi:hypothetical protein
MTPRCAIDGASREGFAGEVAVFHGLRIRRDPVGAVLVDGPGAESSLPRGGSSTSSLTFGRGRDGARLAGCSAVRPALHALALLSLVGLAPACSDGGTAGPPDDAFAQVDGADATKSDDALAHLDGADAREAGLEAAPDGGFCCPIDPPTCECFRPGGWTATDDPLRCPCVWDMAPPAEYGFDNHGCPVISSSHSCLERDTGVPPQPPDAGDACASGSCTSADAASDAADAG